MPLFLPIRKWWCGFLKHVLSHENRSLRVVCVRALVLGLIRCSSQSKPLHWFHWEQGQKLLMNKLRVWDYVFQVVESALMSNRTNKEQSPNTMQCFHAVNGTGIGNVILQRGNKGYLSYKGTLIFFFFLKELVNSIVKSFIKTHSRGQDLSENDWINKNLQNSLNRKVTFCLIATVLSLQFLYLLTSLPAHLMSCEFSLFQTEI